eukprot:jgi/Bigna1/66455/fgenesh1_pg.1_\
MLLLLLLLVLLSLLDGEKVAEAEATTPTKRGMLRLHTPSQRGNIKTIGYVPGSPEYVRTTFQVLPVPSGPTRHPTPLFVSRSPVWRPSASPTRNPTRTNQTYTPTATTSPAVNKHFPTSSPTIAEVPYPPLDHLQAILPELKRMIQTIEPKEIIPEPSAYWILLIVFGGGSCLGATAYVVKRFLIDKYILGPGAGSRRCGSEEEDKKATTDDYYYDDAAIVISGIAMELDKFDSGPNMPAADGDVSLQQGGEGAVGGEGGEGGGGGDVKSRLSTSGTGVPDEKPGDDHDDDLDDYLENRRRSQMGSGMFGEVNLGPSSTPTIAAAAQTDNKGRVDPSGGFAPAAAAAAEAEAAVEVKLPVIVPPPRPPSPVNTEEDAANDVIQNLNLGGWERVGTSAAVAFDGLDVGNLLFQLIIMFVNLRTTATECHDQLLTFCTHNRTHATKHALHLNDLVESDLPLLALLATC